MVGIFPGRDSIIRLVGAVLAEQNDEWTESRRHLGWKSSPPAGRPANPGLGQDITNEAGLTIEATPA